MPFTPKDWRDYPDTSTPITAAAMEDVETRLSAYSDTVQTALDARLDVIEADALQFGLAAAIPAAATAGAGARYFATDYLGGSELLSDGAAWHLLTSANAELDRADRTTTFASASRAASTYEDVLDDASVAMSVSFVPIVNMAVRIRAGFALWNANANTARPRAQITDGANAAVDEKGFNNGATDVLVRQGPNLEKRIDATAGVTYTYKLRVGNATGGTTAVLTLFGGAGAGNIWITAERA